MIRPGLTAALLAMALAGAARPQEAPRPDFVLVNQERILTDSRRGRALLADEEAARDALRAEARAVETAFEAEERRLTEQRATLAAEAFRARADDFDARVEAARREQDAKANALAVELDQRRRRFFAEVTPILVGVMGERGAYAILDETSVLLADPSLDITEAVIAAIDRQPEPAPGGAPAPAPAAE